MEGKPDEGLELGIQRKDFVAQLRIGGSLAQSCGSLCLALGWVLLPGIVAMNLTFSAFLSAISIIWDLEFGFRKEVLALFTCFSVAGAAGAFRRNM